MHVVCIIYVVNKYTVAVSVMCMCAALNTCNVMYYNIMFAACTCTLCGFCTVLLIFIITKSLSVLYCFSYCYYYYLLIVLPFISQRSKKILIFSFKTPPLAHAQFENPSRGWPSYL